MTTYTVCPLYLGQLIISYLSTCTHISLHQKKKRKKETFIISSLVFWFKTSSDYWPAVFTMGILYSLCGTISWNLLIFTHISNCIIQILVLLDFFFNLKGSGFCLSRKWFQKFLSLLLALSSRKTSHLSFVAFCLFTDMRFLIFTDMCANGQQYLLGTLPMILPWQWRLLAFIGDINQYSPLLCNLRFKTCIH